MKFLLWPFKLVKWFLVCAAMVTYLLSVYKPEWIMQIIQLIQSI